MNYSKIYVKLAGRVYYKFTYFFLKLLHLSIHSSLLLVTIMTSIETADHKMDWLPGLSNPSYSASNSVSTPRADFETGLNTQTTDPNVDEVQFSIVCEDCGKHFWSRSKAVSHAALTAHVLNEELMLSPSPVIIPESPVTGSASAPGLNTAATSAMDAEVGQKADAVDDYEDSEDGEDEDESICFDCGRHFWSQKAAHNHIMIGHVHGADIAPSSASSGSPWAATFAPGMSEQTTSRAVSPINQGHNGGVNQAAPGHHGYLNGTQTYRTNFNEHEFAVWSRKNVGGSAVPNVSQKDLRVDRKDLLLTLSARISCTLLRDW